MNQSALIFLNKFIKNQVVKITSSTAMVLWHYFCQPKPIELNKKHYQI